ncbi:MAG: thioredoxin family protein [Gemmatimonadaceae bacterium]
MNLRDRFRSALSFAEFLAAATKNVELWRDLYRLSVVPAAAAARVHAFGVERHLLILAEDWCGDAVNTVPVIVRLAEASGTLDVRLLGRDSNPELMDSHLTNGSRSIPLVMVLDECFDEIARWGPRPHELQSWLLATGLGMETTPRYRHVRAWYARDHGETTLAEMLAILAAGLQRR